MTQHKVSSNVFNVAASDIDFFLTANVQTGPIK